MKETLSPSKLRQDISQGSQVIQEEFRFGMQYLSLESQMVQDIFQHNQSYEEHLTPDSSLGGNPAAGSIFEFCEWCTGVCRRVHTFWCPFHTDFAHKAFYSRPGTAEVEASSARRFASLYFRYKRERSRCHKYPHELSVKIKKKKGCPSSDCS